jgi:hypothetical protein
MPTGTLQRRTLLKGAAWSAPVIAVAIAAPASSASTAGADVVWASSSTDLLAIGLLAAAGTGGALVTTNVLPTGPLSFTVNNPTAGAIVGPLTGTIAIEFSSGLPLISVKGFGVYSIDGDPANVSDRIETPDGVWALGSTYATTQNITVPSTSIAGGGSLTVPVVFGLTAAGLLGVSVAVSYTITLTLWDADSALIGTSAVSSIIQPIGLNIL